VGETAADINALSVAIEIVSGIPCRYKFRSLSSFSKNYPLPPSYYVRLPDSTDRICFPREGEIGVYMKNFSLGLRFPLHPSIVSILRFLGIPIAQMPPNSLGLIVAFTSLCYFAGVVPSVSVFRYFFRKFVHPEGGWVGVSARNKRKLLKTNTSNKNWKNGFVFIGCLGGFPFPSTFNIMNPEASWTVQLTEEEEEDVQTLLNVPEELRDVDFLVEEDQLFEAKICLLRGKNPLLVGSRTSFLIL
jgi:hypothetical protein